MPIRDKIRPSVGRIASQLVEHGHEAYLVGGAVRDLLLGIEPKDYDIATSASPEEIREVFGRRRSRIIGRRFRLAHVYDHGEVYEVSTFRREPTAEERRGREEDDGVMLWRDNAYGNLEEDAERRDFTVNAMYYDVVGDRGVIDFVGGVEDLESRTVRAIGDTPMRMAEDPVRMLRALKLVGQFGFTLQPLLRQTIEDLGDRIRLASVNRLFEELLKILNNTKGLEILAAFHDHGFLRSFWPNVDELWDTPTGELLRGLLAERGRRLEGRGYPTSKALLLSTLLLAPIAAAFGDGEPAMLWEHQPGHEHICRQLIHEFMSPFSVSRFLSARTRDICQLVPRIKAGFKRGRIIRHPEYRYGYELFSLLLAATGESQDALDDWPRPRPSSKGGRRRGSPRQGGRRPKGTTAPSSEESP
jgi:poly(A) polymerase